MRSYIVLDEIEVRNRRWIWQASVYPVGHMNTTPFLCRYDTHHYGDVRPVALGFICANVFDAISWEKLAAVLLVLTSYCLLKVWHDYRVSRRVMLTYKEIYIFTLIHIWNILSTLIQIYIYVIMQEKSL